MTDDPKPNPAPKPDDKPKGPKLPKLSDEKWAEQERFIGRNNRDRD